MNNGREITVPYGDFVDGITAQADLDCLRQIISSEKFYLSTETAVKRILGIDESREEEICLKDSQE